MLIEPSLLCCFLIFFLFLWRRDSLVIYCWYSYTVHPCNIILGGSALWNSGCIHCAFQEQSVAFLSHSEHRDQMGNDLSIFILFLYSLSNQSGLLLGSQNKSCLLPCLFIADSMSEWKEWDWLYFRFWLFNCATWAKLLNFIPIQCRSLCCHTWLLRWLSSRDSVHIDSNIWNAPHPLKDCYKNYMRL